jgi:hypothetical protein
MKRRLEMSATERQTVLRCVAIRHAQSRVNAEYELPAYVIEEPTMRDIYKPRETEFVLSLI